MKRRVYFFFLAFGYREIYVSVFFGGSSSIEIIKQTKGKKNKHKRQEIDFYIVADVDFVFVFLSTVIYLTPLACCLGVRCGFGPVLLRPPLVNSDVDTSPESSPLLFVDDC